MECIENFLKDLEEINQRTREKIRSLPWPEPGTFYVPKGFKWKVKHFFNEVKMVKGSDGIYRKVN